MIWVRLNILVDPSVCASVVLPKILKRAAAICKVMPVSKTGRTNFGNTICWRRFKKSAVNPAATTFSISSVHLSIKPGLIIVRLKPNNKNRAITPIQYQDKSLGQCRVKQRVRTTNKHSCITWLYTAGAYRSKRGANVKTRIREAVIGIDFNN